jgi:hypothetical protein
MHATAYLHHAGLGRIFVAYFDLAPFADQADYSVKRWRCRGYHATGAIDLVGAAIHMTNLHADYGLRTASVLDLGHLLWDGEAGLTVITGVDGRPINAALVDVSGPQAVSA